MSSNGSSLPIKVILSCKSIKMYEFSHKPMSSTARPAWLRARRPVLSVSSLGHFYTFARLFVIKSNQRKQYTFEYRIVFNFYT